MKPPLRILFILIALSMSCITWAAPKHEVAESSEKIERPVLSLKKLMPSAEESLNILGAELHEIVKHPLNERCEVGLSAAKSWRPLQNYGDTDNKLRVYNPTLGVALSYRF